jgi:hypothetical protein
MPFRPFTAISIDSEPGLTPKVNPALLPDKVPPLLVKSIELLANAAIGKARASRTIHKMRFIKIPLLNLTRANYPEIESPSS